MNYIRLDSITPIQVLSRQDEIYDVKIKVESTDQLRLCGNVLTIVHNMIVHNIT